MKKTEISVIIPAYNEADTIAKVIGNVDAVMKRTKISYNILVIDDGSKDSTAKEVKKTKAILIQHPYNKGYGASLKTGTKSANSEFVLFVDADGQHDATDILEIIKERAKYDMIVGARPKDMAFKAFRGF